jgi:glycine cleavage system H protein
MAILMADGRSDMSNIQPGLRYTDNHEYVNVEGKVAKIGITDHAQHELTEIVFVELPSVGKEVAKGDVIANVESVKTVSEVFAPVSGTVKEVNGTLLDSPELLNIDPYGEGWMVKVEMNDVAEAIALMSFDDYRKLLGE